MVGLVSWVWSVGEWVDAGFFLSFLLVGLGARRGFASTHSWVLLVKSVMKEQRTLKLRQRIFTASFSFSKTRYPHLSPRSSSFLLDPPFAPGRPSTFLISSPSMNYIIPVFINILLLFLSLLALLWDFRPRGSSFLFLVPPLSSFLVPFLAIPKRIVAWLLRFCVRVH